MSEKEKDVQSMAKLLRQGATLTQLSCPACSSPLFKIGAGDLWCAQCNKRVIVVKEGDNEGKAAIPSVLEGLESTILNKIMDVDKKIRGETSMEEIHKLSSTLFMLLKALEKIRRFKN